MHSKEIIKKLKLLACQKRRDTMAHFGSNPEKALGVAIPQLRSLAKGIKKNHHLAVELWETNIHEARILASIIDEIDKLTEEQMDNWVQDFNSWDLCDQVCQNLFIRSSFTQKKIIEWSIRPEEFVKRTAFTLIANTATHAKTVSTEQIALFFTLIKQAASDERNFVKKAVNWALRQLGKRSLSLNQEALVVAQDIRTFDSKSARWIAQDAIKELSSDAVHKRLIQKNLFSEQKQK
jgi:3-methyladenine DNA glycosylase AlkD